MYIYSAFHLGRRKFLSITDINQKVYNSGGSFSVLKEMTGLGPTPRVIYLQMQAHLGIILLYRYLLLRPWETMQSNSKAAVAALLPVNNVPAPL